MVFNSDAKLQGTYHFYCFVYSGEEFSLFRGFFVIFAGNEREMTHTDFDGIIFADTLQEFNALRYAGRVIHILCSGGNMGFTFQDTRYNIAAGDYVILPNATLVSEFFGLRRLFKVS